MLVFSQNYSTSTVPNNLLETIGGTTTGIRVEEEKVPDPYNCENCRRGTCEKIKPIYDFKNDVYIPNFTCSCEENWTGEDCNACDGRRLIRNNTGGFIRHGDKTLKNYRDESSCSWLIKPEYLDNLGSNDVIKPIHLTILEFSSECDWDWMWIYDGHSAQDKKLITLRACVWREVLPFLKFLFWMLVSFYLFFMKE